MDKLATPGPKNSITAFLTTPSLKVERMSSSATSWGPTPGMGVPVR
ncbi:Uncharacterised protein [Flavonifractor plautii]|uniref:Uncharacterized protein n=1 Tax=Flavonifractor plautii TaxID=292800 RepID=A0A174QKU3_FLAPL|nr:Uncharacterised protein [Flavonifractor plautii]